MTSDNYFIKNFRADGRLIFEGNVDLSEPFFGYFNVLGESQSQGNCQLTVLLRSFCWSFCLVKENSQKWNFFPSDIILDGLFGALAMLALWGVTNILSTLGCILLIKVPKNVDIWAWHDSALFSLNLTMSRWLTQNSKKWRKSVVDLQATSTSFMILLESSFC